mmetsp:Transcript_8883/g.9853  ORF Transcript_8883/g.9853 Transcript_8883/m.9853 type:complete len:357 (+) Transcript_8883:34-1104(+)
MKRHAHTNNKVTPLKEFDYANEKDRPKDESKSVVIAFCGLQLSQRALLILTIVIIFITVPTLLYLTRVFSTLCFSYAASLKYNIPVDRLDIVETVTSKRLFEYYKRYGIPLKITHGMKGYPAVGKWSPEWFAQKFGPESITVAFGNTEQRRTVLEDTTVRQFVDFFKTVNDSSTYLPYWSEDGAFLYENDLSEDVLDLPILSEYPSVVDVELYLWFGPMGTVTGAHIDYDPLNVLFQVYGEKRVWMFHPKYFKNLYPSGKFDPGAILSEVDILKPNYEKHPKFKDAKPIVVDIKAGEQLYIPSGWFHVAVAKTHSISISGRALTACEVIGYQWVEFKLFLHNLGLYKHKNCVCHTN